MAAVESWKLVPPYLEGMWVCVSFFSYIPDYGDNIHPVCVWEVSTFCKVPLILLTGRARRRLNSHFGPLHLKHKSVRRYILQTRPRIILFRVYPFASPKARASLNVTTDVLFGVIPYMFQLEMLKMFSLVCGRFVSFHQTGKCQNIVHTPL